jgi:hypothetical protein
MAAPSISGINRDMSDYLGNLAARTLAPTTLVRPQLLSQFEPPPLRTGVKQSIGFELDTQTESAAPEPVNQRTNTSPRILPPLQQPVVPAPVMSEDRASKPVGRDDGEARHLRELRPATQISAPSKIFSEPSGQGDDSETARDATPVTHKPTPPVPFVPVVQERSRETPPPALIPELTPVVGRDEVQPPAAFPLERPARLVREIFVESLSGQPPADPGPRLSVMPEPVTKLKVESPAIRPNGAASGLIPPMPQSAAKDALPTINVTIGRIEIRAAPPATPAPRRSATRAPAMKLDEYLKQRAAGGQR